MRPELPGSQTVLPYLESMEKTRVFSNFGPLVTSAEERIGELLGVDSSRVVLTASATQALIGVMQVVSIARWTSPVYTFAATCHAIRQAGAQPAFVDIDSRSWIATPTEHETEVTGFLPVTPFGASVDLHQWADVDHLLVDAAASFGNPPTGISQIGPMSAVVFSLHATKVLPVGEGGVLVCGSAALATEFKRWSNFGFDSQRRSQVVGSNAKMSEVTAAYLHASLDEWDEACVDWRSSRARATEIARHLGIQPTALPGDEISPYWIVQFANGGERKQIETAMAQSGVETRRWWPDLLSDMPAFTIDGGQAFPNADHVCQSILGLPMYRRMGSREFDVIERVLADVLTQTRGPL